MVTEILHRRHHPEQGYRASLGLMRLGRQYGMERLEAACARALRLGAYGYRTVKNILSTGLDRLCSEQETSKPLAPMPHHAQYPGRGLLHLGGNPMLKKVHATLEKMQTMKLSAMAEAFEAQRGRSSEYTRAQLRRAPRTPHRYRMDRTGKP